MKELIQESLNQQLVQPRTFTPVTTVAIDSQKAEPQKLDTDLPSNDRASEQMLGHDTSLTATLP